jgi:signal transduction histidine kinase
MSLVLPSHNRLQRLYFTWAQPYYDRMPADLRADAQRLDLFLYSRRGLGVWAGLAAAFVGSAAGLRGSGFPLWLALLCSALLWGGLPLAVLGAWLRPDRFTPQRLLRNTLLVVLGAYSGALVGFFTARLTREGGLATQSLGEALWAAALRTTPFLLVAVLALLLMMWGVSSLRRWQTQRALAAAQQAQERDAVARRLAEAQLRVLQAQIQPHFIFNTLAALQHWVDTADPRAPALLRALTGFLRASTELLGRERVPLAEEAAMVRHYLDIQRARIGDRLSAVVEIDPACAGQPVPPGLLLTLVENAVEHGIAPALAGGEVKVLADCTGGALCIRVEDDGVGLPQPLPLEGVGLRNSRERLAALFGEAARLSLQPRPGGGAVTLLTIGLEPTA